MRRRVLAAAALGLMLAGCGGAKEKQFTKADADEIRQRTQELVSAVNAKDLAKAAEFYAGTATFMPPNAATLHGRDSVRLYYQSMMESTTQFTMEPRDVGGVVPAAGPGLAYANGTYSMTAKSGAGETRDRGKYLLVMRNNGGQWRCEYGMWNSDLPKEQAGDR